ncbi:MAG: glycosyltransferase family 2 protein [Gammaproteobacteria bacterium]
MSVILPTFNRIRTVRKSIMSVLRQDYEDLELIVVDDGSSDGTAELLKTFNDPRLRVISLAQNSGQSAARNIGIEAACGTYVAFQDSDDLWTRNKLKTQLERLQKTAHYRLSGGFCAFTVIGGKQSRTRMPRGVPNDYKPASLYNMLLKDNVVGTPTLLIERTILQNLGGFDEKLDTLEDWDLALRLAAKGHALDYIPHSLVLSRWSRNGVNTRPSAMSIYRILEKHLGVQEPEQKACIVKHYQKLVKEFFSLGDRVLGSRCFWNGISLDPRLRNRLKFTRYRVHGALSAHFKQKQSR